MKLRKLIQRIKKVSIISDIWKSIKYACVKTKGFVAFITVICGSILDILKPVKGYIAILFIISFIITILLWVRYKKRNKKSGKSQSYLAGGISGIVSISFLFGLILFRFSEPNGFIAEKFQPIRKLQLLLTKVTNVENKIKELYIDTTNIKEHTILIPEVKTDLEEIKKYIKVYSVTETEKFKVEVLLLKDKLANSEKINEAFLSSIDESYKRMTELYKARHYDEAIEKCFFLLDLIPEVPITRKLKAMIYTTIGHCYSGKKEYNNEIKYYFTATQYAPELEEAYWSLGITYCTSGKVEEGISELRKIGNFKPDYGLVYFVIGLIYKVEKRYPEAIAELEKATKLEPKAFYHSILGDCYYFLNKYDEALKSYTNAITLDSNDGDAYYSLGATYWQKKMYKDAIDNFRKVKTLQPNSTKGYLGVAHCYMEKKMYDEAIMELKEGLKIEEDALLLGAIGSCYIEKNNSDQAILYLKKAKVGKPFIPEVYLELGLVYLQNKMFDKALKEYREYLKYGKEPQCIEKANLIIKWLESNVPNKSSR